jgi:endonuclease/exonuclease/phosphatase family metal-dependent hydrolase
MPTRSPRGSVETITVPVQELSRRRRLWAEAVGSPVALDVAPGLPDGDPLAVDVLSWNLAIGLGRLDEVLVRARSDRPLVILAQEAFRADDSVPEKYAWRAHGGRLRPARRDDIVDFARAHGLSLRYVPSMRNGASRSDRGNAILASVALEAGVALILPYVRQRRVAVAARLVGLPDVTFVSAHLDTPLGLRPGRRAQARELARAAIEHAGDGDVVLGADLNALRGRRDPVVRPLLFAGFEPVDVGGTFRGAAPLVMPFDHMLVRLGRGRLGSPAVRHLVERPPRRRRSVFGSDHHPLLARIPLREGD